VHLLSTGRTSLVPDASFDDAFYKLAGYRHLGSRAVRVDILERLADLIRPALQWRDGSGTLPDGAVGGGRFFVTPAMMSILGATAEDMEAVLGSLGYRHDKVEPAEFEAKLAALKEASAPAAEAPAEAQPQAASEEQAAEAPAEPPEGEAPAAEPVAEVAETEAAEAEQPTPAPEEATAPAAPEPAAEATPAQAPEEPTAEPAEAAEPAETPEPEDEPKPVMVWYQVRGERNRRGNRPQGQRQEGQRGEGQRHEGEQRNRNKGARGKFRGKRDGDQPHGKGPGKGKGEAFASSRPPRRDKPLDPDSPFAKLAALKDQMKK
jgi:ATP-dependent RNA helicase SUPV3L1/SUV3